MTPNCSKVTAGQILTVEKWPGVTFQRWKMTGRVIFQWDQFSTLHLPERFAGVFIICNWIVCPSFCPFISPFVNYSLSLTNKVQYLDFEWSQSIQSKVQWKFIDGLLTRQWHHMPIGIWVGSKYMYRAWIFCKILTLLPSGAFVFHELILLYNHSQISYWLWVTGSKFKVILTIGLWNLICSTALYKTLSNLTQKSKC